MDSLDRTSDETTWTVEQVFESILENHMGDFRDVLQFFKENKYGAVWSNENELHEKTMIHAKKFVCNVTKTFRTKHEEVSSKVEGSACDVFQKYFLEKLKNLRSDSISILERSIRDTEVEFSHKLSKMKESLEKEKGKVPKTKSDIEDMISSTELSHPVHLHHSMLCCRVAYDCDDPEHPEKCLEKLDEKHLLGELIVSYENSNVPRYVMARCGDVLYVAFRGLQLSRCRSAKSDWRGQVCSGVIEEAKKIPLGYFAREIYQEKRIIFSGHSTGGTIAALVVIFLLDKFKHLPKDYLKSNLRCITFGVTPVGDTSLKNYVESMPGVRECFCHIVQKDDIIPKLFGSLNNSKVQGMLLKLVDELFQMPLNMLLHFQGSSRWKTVATMLANIKNIAQSSGIMNCVLPVFDIFGIYYILDSSINEGQKYRVLDANMAKDCLTLQHTNLLDMRNDHLINHRIERYEHEIRVCLAGELTELHKFSHCTIKKPEDITPKISEVQFENIGKQVVAKIAGSSMWFVYQASIGDDKNLNVDYMWSTESEVQTRMPKSHLSHSQNVSVRVKTHFENSKYMPAKTVPARTTTYEVSRRQEQLAKHSPRKVIELAYLSALLERRDEEIYSKRYHVIKTFFNDAVSVVPIESLFHAMATAHPHIVAQCSEIFLLGNTLTSPSNASEFLLNGMRNAIHHIEAQWGEAMEDVQFLSAVKQMGCVETRIAGYRAENFPMASSELDPEELIMYSPRNPYQDQRTSKDWTAIWNLRKYPLKARAKMKTFLGETGKSFKSIRAKCLCDLNLEAIYPSSDVEDGGKENSGLNKAPMTLLVNGRRELNQFSEEMGAKQDKNSDECGSSNTNSEMLKVLNALRKNFETCSTLLGAFMEAQVQVPLERQGKTYVNTIANYANSFGLDVWGLLILPFRDVERMLKRLPGRCQRLVVDLACSMYALYDRLSVDKRQFTNYDGKLEFLLTSMKKSSTSNREFVSYSLERQLEEQCRKRNINDKTALDDILQQWQANFEDETLTLVPDRYRPLVARWIKWSLMINHLRESIAEQTAVGVIGLVNSGKSKFVRSIFGIQTVTGTTAQKRTTVPFIYNLEPEIKGMDVIDFPGVDDQDETIPDLAMLLLSLTRIVVFVVDYKRAHTQSTKDWLNILEKENVPVLICLSFADKLYAELMGEGGSRDVKEVKAEIQMQLKGIKDQIGQPEIGQRDFKFTVFAFDNDSQLNCEEGKDKLRQAGLNDELDVGRWIAEKLEANKQSDLSQRVFNFIQGKEKSTLNSNKSTHRKRAQFTQKATDQRDIPKRRREVKVESSEDQPTCSKDIPKKRREVKVKSGEDRPTCSKYS